MSATETSLNPKEDLFPTVFNGWFAERGWRPHPHQAEMVGAAQAGAHTLLIAPTGGGKTLSGFLASMIDLARHPIQGLHTVYISPLKALAVDIHRNLELPIAEMGLKIRCETRTGDTPQGKRVRQKLDPPNILLTTPESLALMVSYEEAWDLFAGLKCVIVDEVHALAGTKRGDQLSLCMARLSKIAPAARRVGLSATVAHEDALQSWLSPGGDASRISVIRGGGGARAQVSVLDGLELPWSGHYALHAAEKVYQEIRKAGVTIVFVNTRGQAETLFQTIWRLNEDNLPIALHHGSLAVEQRRKVEAAMASGLLRGVVATSSLDLGIDWAAVDLVIQMGAPKGVSRLLQRIGRAGHRLDTPSRAILAPGNRFEVLECMAAIEGVDRMRLDGDVPPPGGLDVLAQHILGLACSAPFTADDLYAEITSAGAYADLSRQDFDDVLSYVEDGGYALRAYDRYKRLFRKKSGEYEVAGPRIAQRHRMNIGTIVQEPMVKLKLRRGPVLGEMEEYFINALEPGDTFMFAGRLLRFDGYKETTAMVVETTGDAPKIPAYMGGRMPFTTYLSDRVREMLSDPAEWRVFPEQVSEWLRLQQWRSVLPGPDGLLVESFPRRGKEYLVAYCFAGRNAHQTLGMLLTRRMERMGYGPLGFVASDYVIAVWSLRPVTDIAGLFDEDMMGDDLQAWMDESSLMRRTFRNAAIIAGLIERRMPGQEKTGRQVTFSADLIYNVLREHQPDHILLRATQRDAAAGMTDVARLADMLHKAQGKIIHRRLDRVSPLAVPILLEIGKESVYGSGVDELLAETADALVEEAMGGEIHGELPLT